MDKSLIEKYKAEMMEMYRSSKESLEAKPVMASTNEPKAMTEASLDTENSSTGKLIVSVTAIRSLYPISNAKVTVFSGDLENREIIATDFTDQSGRTEEFVLQTPEKSLSLSFGAESVPYATYGVEINAEGYVDSIFLNIPVFSGVTSIQRVNMLLLETAGKDKGPLIFDEAQKYELNSSKE